MLTMPAGSSGKGTGRALAGKSCRHECANVAFALEMQMSEVLCREADVEVLMAKV